jgi:hypothetical protein
VAEPMTTGSPTAAGSRNVLSRLIGVVFSPRAAYADVAARPRVLGALALVVAIIVSATFTFLSTELGQRVSLENQIQQMESFGRTVNDAQYAQMERMAPYSKYFAAGAQLIVTPIMALIIAGLAFAVFNAIMGGDASFKAVYAIVVHSGAILVLQPFFGLPLAYARESMSSATNLAVFFPFLDDTSFTARLLGSIDLFLIWWIVSLSIGLGVLYRKRTGPIATTMLIVYVLIGVLIATIKSMTSGA